MGSVPGRSGVSPRIFRCSVCQDVTNGSSVQILKKATNYEAEAVVGREVQATIFRTSM